MGTWYVFDTSVLERITVEAYRTHVIT
jgi:hypothetical protein